MTTEKSILEVRRHPLLAAIIIAITVSIAAALCLAFAPLHPCEEIVAEPAIGGWIDGWQMAHPVWSLIIVGVGMAYVAIKLSQLVSRFGLYGTTTHLPMELFPLLSVGVMVNVASLRVFVTVLLVAYSLMRYVSSYRNINSVGTLLSGSLGLGLATLLSPSTILLWGCVPFVLVIFERTLREVIVAIVSLAIIPFGYVYVQWVMGADFVEVWSRFVALFVTQSGYLLFESYSIEALVMSGVLLFLTLNAVLAMSLLENTVKARRRLRVVIVYWAASVAMFAMPSADSSIFAVVAIPLSVLIPIALLKFGRLVSFIIYVLLFLLAAMVNVGVAIL